MLATCLPVAQWLERLTGVRKVVGSIPVGDSDFFFVPRSWHVEYSIFSYYENLLFPSFVFVERAY